VDDVPFAATRLRWAQRRSWVELLGAGPLAARATRAPSVIGLYCLAVYGGILADSAVLCALPAYILLTALFVLRALDVAGRAGGWAPSACAALDEGLLLLGPGCAALWRWEFVASVRSGWWGVVLWLREPVGEPKMLLIPRSAWPDRQTLEAFAGRARELQKTAVGGGAPSPARPARRADLHAAARGAEPVAPVPAGARNPRGEQCRRARWVASTAAILGFAALVGTVLLYEPISPAPRGRPPAGIYVGALPRGPAGPRTFASALASLCRRCLVPPGHAGR
jgi:hypothetical protein